MTTVVLVMGVAGSGKTTVGRLLAERLGVEFVDADQYHSPEAVSSMAAGVPLTEEQRGPWLDRLHHELVERRSDGVVMACSALTAHSRDTLGAGIDGLRLVWLRGDPDLIEQRLEDRPGHAVGPSLLPSQLATLEPPDGALDLDVAAPPEDLVARIAAWLDHEV